MFASTRVAELAAVPWTDEQRAQFCDRQFDAQDRHYRQQFPGSTYEIVVEDGQELGRLYVDASGDEIVLLDITLLPEHRGHGVGGQLLRALLEQGRPVLLHVERTNPARRLYERLGFVEVEQGPVYDCLRWRPGSGEDRLVVPTVRAGADRDEEDRYLAEGRVREQHGALVEARLGRSAEQQAERAARSTALAEVDDRHQREGDLGSLEHLAGEWPEGLRGDRGEGVHGARSVAPQGAVEQARPMKGSTMDCTRRTALQLSLVGAAGTALSLSGVPEAAAGSRTTTPTRLERSTFTPLVGSTFTIGTSRAKLSAVRDLRAAPAGSNTRFSLLFTSSAVLAPATYAVAHPSLQTFPLYLGQVGPTVGSYEAVIND